MITRLKLLQTKYSLSNEFIVNAIRSEIERQAMLDIKGIISNCSITGLEDMMSKFTPEPSVVVDDPMVKAPSLVSASVAARKGKRRG